MKANSKNKYAIRKAVFGDIQALVAHHSQMFKEISILQEKIVDQDKYKKMEESQTKKLQDEMPRGLCHAWVVEDDNKAVVASGAISIYSFTASPEDPTYTGAYVHSIYTEKQHRGNKLATLIVKKAISFCQDQNISKMLLIASDAGKPVYEKIGFEPITTLMYMTV